MAKSEKPAEHENEIRAALDFFSTGKFPDSELVIGLVGAVGTGLRKVVADLQTCLQHYSYKMHEVHVSEEIIDKVVEVKQYDLKDEHDRISTLMDGGDDAREETGDNAVLALGTAAL